MNMIPKSGWLAITMAATTPWAPLSAQNTGAADEAEFFELSPFTVTSDDDNGYRATSTTAGSRLNSQLKDVAASVTVLTDAFMDDLGATDVATALSMVAGVETDLTTDTTDLNLAQGFLGGDFNNVNASDGRIRIRGLGEATNSANYLEIFGPLDRFNMERTEFLRGPSALLFGLGEPGGVVNYTPKRGNLQRDINKVDIVLDNFKSRRLQLDFSRVLIEDKLAVRLAAVKSDGRYRVKTAEQDNESIYLTAAYKPFKGARMDAYYENISQQGRRPNYRLPQDNVTDWLREYNRAHAEAAANGGLVPTPDRGGIPLQQYLDDNLVWDASWAFTNNGEAPRSIDIPFTERILTDANGNPLVRPGEYRHVMDVRPAGLTAYYTPEAGWGMPYNGQFTHLGPIHELAGEARASNPQSRLRFHRSSFGNDGVDRSFVDPQILDENIFPVLTQEIGALPGNEREVKSQKFGFNWEQRLNQDLYLNLSYLKEDYTHDQVFAPLAQSHAVSIDINKYLPGSLPNADDFAGNNAATSNLTRRAGLTLEEAVEIARGFVADGISPESNQRFIDSYENRVPNPNYLRPFIHGRQIGGYSDIESEAFLAQANYDFNFADKTDRLAFLGRHRLTGFLSGGENSRHDYRYTSAAQSVEGVLDGSASVVQPAAGTWYTPVWYIGDAVQPGDSGLRLTELPSQTFTGANDPMPFFGWNRSSESGSLITRGSWSEKDEELYWRRTLLSQTPELSTIESGAWGSSLQSFFWSGRIVTTLGYRKDTVQNDAFVLWDNPRAYNTADASDPVNALIIEERIRRGLLPEGFEGNLTNVDFRPTATDTVGDGSLRDDFILSAPQIQSRRTQPLRTNSIVFHATNWLRFFANESENFALTRPTTDGFGRPNPPTSGDTEEYGIGMSLLENKLDMKLTFFETRQKDQLGSGTIRLAARIPSFEGRILNILKREDQLREDGEPTNFDISDWEYQSGLDSDNNPIFSRTNPDEARVVAVDPETNEPIVDPETGARTFDYTIDYNVVPNPGVTQDSVSEGWEFETSYNPNRNLRLSANVSKLENTLSDVEKQSVEYVRIRAPYWNQFFQQGYHVNGDNDDTIYINRVVNSDGSFTRLQAGDPGYIDTTAADYVAPPNSRDADPLQDDSLLISSLYGTFGNELFQAIQNEGSANPGISEYNVRLTANYTFVEGRLKGFFTGTNLRWESGKAFGNPLITRSPDEFPEGFPSPDLNGNGRIDANEPIILQADRANAFESDSFVTGGVWLGYRGKLRDDTINWRIQLNVDNLFKQGGDLRVIRLNADQSPIYGINVPTTFKLTNSFDF